jgi:hypothetical protein
VFGSYPHFSRAVLYETYSTICGRHDRGVIGSYSDCNATIWYLLTELAVSLEQRKCNCFKEEGVPISINIIACLECSCHIWVPQLVYFDKVHHVQCIHLLKKNNFFLLSLFLTFLKCTRRLISWYWITFGANAEKFVLYPMRCDGRSHFWNHWKNLKMMPETSYCPKNGWFCRKLYEVMHFPLHYHYMVFQKIYLWGSWGPG